jgi:hypothetical protein
VFAIAKVLPALFSHRLYLHSTLLCTRTPQPTLLDSRPDVAASAALPALAAAGVTAALASAAALTVVAQVDIQSKSLTQFIILEL